MDPSIRYARTSDGVSIAFWTQGQGTPFIHLTPGTTDLEGEWKIPECRNWYSQLAERWKLVRFNNRGEGLSDRVLSDHLLETCIADLETVVDRVAPDHFVLFGPWYGGLPAVAYAVRHPNRVSHLILYCTFARGADWSDQPQMKAVRSLVDKDWTVYTEAVASTILGWDEGEPARRYAAVLRESVTPEFVLNHYEQVGKWDVSALLPQVSTPTLVIHRRQHILSLDVARNLATGIPNAKLVILHGSSTAPYLGDTAALLAAIEEFTAAAGTPGARHDAGLTDREVEVLRLVAAGRSNREIANELTISINTVDRHVSNIFAKIGASNRAEAASFAVRNGLA